MRKPKQKEYKERDQIIDSIENLKREMMRNTDPRSNEIWFKLNSCLFSEYPHN